MRKAVVRMLAVVGIGFVTGTVVALAQAGPSGPGAGSPASALPAYRPGLGDLMTMTVQPRHAKLWIAGHERNWTYVAYEIHELQEAFERTARVWPQWRDVPVADMIASTMQEPVAAVAAAAKAGDADAFAAAYGSLTQACNACHGSAGRGEIAIKVPDTSAYPDQDFRAPAP